MALIHCTECNHEISDKSKVCVNCGYPINDETYKKRMLLLHDKGFERGIDNGKSPIGI